MGLLFKLEGFLFVCLWKLKCHWGLSKSSKSKIINSINNYNFKSSDNFSHFSEHLTFHRSCNAFFWIIWKAVVHRMWQFHCLPCGQVSPLMRDLSCPKGSVSIRLLIRGIVFPSGFQKPCHPYSLHWSCVTCTRGQISTCCLGNWRCLRAYMIYAYVWLTFEIFNNIGCLVALGHFIPVWIWAVFGQKMLMHMHHCFVHTGTHTHSDTNWYSRLTAELSCWTEKFWEGISPPALLHWGGSSDLPLPLWSGNYAVMAPSWCQHRTLCSLLSTWLSALLLVFLFSLLSWNSICLPSWLKDIFLPFPSSNQSKSEKMSFFCCC